MKFNIYLIENLSFIISILLNITLTQNVIPNIKPIPIFSTETINKAENIILYNNAPLNTEILVAKASTYASAMPIKYDLIDDSSLLKIDPITGSIILFNPIKKLGNYKFTIVAYDSAPFPDTQSSFLIANLAIVSSTNFAPVFNDFIPYYVSVLDIINPNTIIYDKIIVNDNNIGQNGAINVFCNSNSIDNLDANLSCSYFRPEIQMLDLGSFKILIRLLKKLDYNIKRSFLMSIGAQTFGPTNLKTFANVLIDVKSSSSGRPKFENSTYLIAIDSNTKINFNVLKLKVINVLDPDEAYFEIYDSKNNFDLLKSFQKCQFTNCIQYIRVKSSELKPTQYSFKVKFKQVKYNLVLKDEVTINVVIKNSKYAEIAPIFFNKSYTFVISENLKPDEIARNVSIIVKEPENLSPYSSGFFLDLLNPDLTVANDVFELTPNYGVGFLVSGLKLKPSATLDYENGKKRYDFILRATSRSSTSLMSYAKLTILIKDYNEYTPFFQYPSYTTILNNPENYQKDDIILQVKAIDFDNNGLNDLTYSINGPHKERFYINSAGQIKLLKLFDLSKDPSYYNVTLSVSDEDGLSSVASMNVYLNITTPFILKNSLFECSINGIRSELNRTNAMTLMPPLYIQTNSLNPLKYVLIDTLPAISNINVNQITGEISLVSPLSDYILSNYDRIIVNVQIFQIQTYETIDLYLSSIICSGTIYLRPFTGFSPVQQIPYFLGQYSITIDRESVYKSTPLLKVDAISLNLRSSNPISYSITDSNDELFVIDSINGFLYSRYDLGLLPKTYNVQIKATDPSNNLNAITTAYITVTYRQNHDIKCDTNYLIIRLSSYEMLYNANEPIIFGKVNCFSDSPFNDSSINYVISASLATFDCKGNQIDYTPKIGIDSTNGNIASFESLSTDKFCDTSFLITVRQDDTVVLIPFKLILLQITALESPVFINTLTNITYIPNYVHVNSYITTVTAYDPYTQQVVDNYKILSEKSSPSSPQKYFKIHSKTGVISLVDIPLVKNVELNVKALSPSGLSSSITINIDLSSFISNYYPKLEFEPNLPDIITLSENNVYNTPIYQANLVCYAKSDSTPNGCGVINYSLNYLPSKSSNQVSFVIDPNTANVYIEMSNNINHLIQSKYLLIINAQSQYYSNDLTRHINNVQKYITIQINSANTEPPVFEYNFYKVQILENTQVDTNILSMRYSIPNRDISPQNLDFRIEQLSNIQINNYLGLIHYPKSKIINIIVKSSPLPRDKPEISFIIRINAKNTSLTSYSTVNIKLLASNSYFLTTYPSFLSPLNASYLLMLNRAFLINNQIIFSFATTNPFGNSHVVYRILNKDSNERFYIENNNLKIVYPIPSDLTTANAKRLSYLLFIEANDLNNPLLLPTYTTLDIRLNNLIDIYPYFLREPSAGRLTIDISDTVNLDDNLFDFTYYVYKPLIDAKLPITYYYVYNNYEPYTLSDTFYIDSLTNQLKLNKTLNATSKNYYSLFVYATFIPTQSVQFYKPENFDISLLYIDIYVINSNMSTYLPYFTDFTPYMIIEDLMPIDHKIGYVSSNDSFNMVRYSFEACDYMSKSMIYRDSQFCALFRLDPFNGIIATNSSNFAPYKNGYFLLKVSSGYYTNSSYRNSIDLKVVIGDLNEKSRFVFKQTTSFKVPTFLNDFKSRINSLLTEKYKEKYYFEFYNLEIYFSSKIKSELDACFYLIHNKRNTIESHKMTVNVIKSLSNIKSLFEEYSISDIERCSNREDEIIYGYGYLYDKYGNWLFTPYSIGLITLAGITLILTFFSILMLMLCWMSHMRQALLAPSEENDIFETGSNNLLLE